MRPGGVHCIPCGTVAAATLARFYTSQGAVLCDAFAAGNLVGGTPEPGRRTCEVHPHNRARIFTLTDAAAGSDGYADSRIFTVAKYTAAVNATQQSGDLLRLDEDGHDAPGPPSPGPASRRAASAGAEDGDPAYANVDNLAFDVHWRPVGRDRHDDRHSQRLGDGLHSPTLLFDREAPQRRRFGGGRRRQPDRGVRHNWMFIPTSAPPLCGVSTCRLPLARRAAR